ncbi:ladderlectin-like [Centropristis striata]|uniref:ladderlectin-like n=1 Tax=Centropristis striata TaxID=184440 RepID=UPI0027E0949E|nr:ladderlectin-like [Centropristis striata]
MAVLSLCVFIGVFFFSTQNDQLIITMKTVLVLSILFCASFAAPAEDKGKAPEEVFAPEDSVPAPRNARFNLCPNGWYSHESRCFLYSQTAMTWHRAEEYCNSLGANLASVTNPREYSFLQQITQNARQSSVWLGGFQLQGQWMWIDREGFYYTNWYGQSSSSSHPCVFLRSSNGWGNTACGNSYYFFCSKSPFRC